MSQLEQNKSRIFRAGELEKRFIACPGVWSFQVEPNSGKRKTNNWKLKEQAREPRLCLPGGGGEVCPLKVFALLVFLKCHGTAQSGLYGFAGFHPTSLSPDAFWCLANILGLPFTLFSGILPSVKLPETGKLLVNEKKDG